MGDAANRRLGDSGAMEKKLTPQKTPTNGREEAALDVGVAVDASVCGVVGKHWSGRFDAKKAINCVRLCPELSACHGLDLHLPVIRRELAPIGDRWLADSKSPSRLGLGAEKFNDFFRSHASSIAVAIGKRYARC